MENINQFIQQIRSAEFSPEAKEKIDVILDRMEKTQLLTKEDKQELSDLIKADMVLDGIEIEHNEGILEEIDKAIEDLK
jgi:hypothetical protein